MLSRSLLRWSPLVVPGLLAGVLATLIAPVAAQVTPAPAVVAAPKEVRGVWVVRTDLTAPASVTKMVGLAKKNGLNTLFVQCRGRGDAYYCNALEPRAQALCKCAADFDPLAQSIAEGHAAGLKVHAWVNSCYVWSEKKQPESADHLVRAKKAWLAVHSTGARCAVGDSEVFICPGNPEARAHLVDICRDLAKRYDVDGIQLDYIRYANPDLCYCDGCLDRFAETLNGKVPAERIAALRTKARTALPAAYPSSWRQFRRNQVTSLVQEIRTAVKAEKPAALLSAAVIAWGTYPGDFQRSEAYNLVAQDWYGWIRQGLVDAVCPMTYQPSSAGFSGWVNAIHRSHPDFPVWYGIGAYLCTAESAVNRVQTVRKAGGKGWVLFSYTSVTKQGTNDAYLRTLKARVISSESAASR